jgi:hypothetical protein
LLGGPQSTESIISSPPPVTNLAAVPVRLWLPRDIHDAPGELAVPARSFSLSNFLFVGVPSSTAAIRRDSSPPVVSGDHIEAAPLPTDSPGHAEARSTPPEVQLPLDRAELAQQEELRP